MVEIFSSYEPAGDIRRRVEAVAYLSCATKGGNIHGQKEQHLFV